MSTATRTRPPAAPASRGATRTPSAPARRARPGFGAVDWRATLLALGSLLAAYGSLHTVLQDISWWLVGAAFAAGVFLAAALTRTWTRSRWAPPLVAIGLSILGVTAGFGGDKAFLGLLPTFESGDAINAVVAQGWESIQEQRVPARPDLGIVLLLALLMIGCALFADAAVAIVRAPALVAAPVLTLLAVPVMVRPGLGDPLWYLLAAGLFLGVLRIGRRPASGAVVVLTGAIVLGGSLVAPTFL
ncbi:MAG TPA: transglutaminaseTgpA domain-containing protein, partial [Pseudolysinimonas sp.]|nr:transglutaminaseTgpA domain-containing protein [Pseudolysinimonas sp.]